LVHDSGTESPVRRHLPSLGRGRLRALRIWCPGPRTHDRCICRPPHCQRKLGRAHVQTWRVGPRGGKRRARRRGHDSSPSQARDIPHCWQTGTYRGGWESRRTIHGYAVSARAGTTEFARHGAVPDRVMASADDQAILRPNRGPKSGGPNLAQQPSKGPAKSAITAYPWVGHRDTRLPGPSPFARKRGVSPFTPRRRCASRRTSRSPCRWSR
jgi:hypothetical protein